MSAAGLNAPEGTEQLLSGDLRHRLTAQVWVQRALEPGAQDRDGLGCKRLGLKLEPLLRHRFEGLEKRRASLLAHRARIDTVRDELPRLVALLTRAFEPDVWIGAERDQFLATAHPILEPPQAPAGRRHEQKQAALVVELVRFFTRLRSANLRITEHRYLTPTYPTTVNVPQRVPQAQMGMPKDTIRQPFTRKAFFSVSYENIKDSRGRGRTRRDKFWRLGSESNRRRRLCRPLHDHSAT